MQIRRRRWRASLEGGEGIATTGMDAEHGMREGGKTKVINGKAEDSLGME
jgi:hypothetical protein